MPFNANANAVIAPKDQILPIHGPSKRLALSSTRTWRLFFTTIFTLTILFAINREPAASVWNRFSLLCHKNSWPSWEESPGKIYWEECVPAVENVECGRIIVPKDYFNSTVGTASIALARYKAQKSPRKGSVFLNPGGPGGPGTKMAINMGSQMAKLIGDDWDLIGFDPRGIGSTRPATRCFSSAAEEVLFFANTVIEQGITVSSISNFSSPLLYDELVEQHQKFLALKQTQAELCRKNMGDDLRYMGTATVVRDIDFMAKAIEGENEKINYWGGSYGSILGAYLVNMLPPSRIGYVAIDGIADPVSWSNEPSHKWPINWLADAEKTYQIFLQDCSKVPLGFIELLSLFNWPSFAADLSFSNRLVRRYVLSLVTHMSLGRRSDNAWKNSSTRLHASRSLFRLEPDLDF
ncbi:hypothetical protein GYMLUDRAFT_547834 [Collybiopsis luxurians FD-317 M1]|nr:hypothetical protein GYMLUDRAFT_547834 [Collybiopsis luxurians FD-317 M1]